MARPILASRSSQPIARGTDALAGPEPRLPIPADLTRREFELIRLLAQARGRVMEREEIHQRVWGYAMVRGDRSVDVFVRKLRKKLERMSPRWRYIHTHFGIGYRFAPELVDDGPVEAPATVREVAGRVPEDVQAPLELVASS